MQNFIREYLDEWSRRKKSSRKISIAVMLMAVIVAGGVISFLVQYGIAMTEKPKCGLTEHGHGEGCFGRQIVCAQEEGEEHQHTDACYEDILSCAEQEHVHTDICFSDVSAGVEDQSVWDGQYAAVEWKGNWAEDLLTAARMQLGYQENEDNFTVAEDGSHKGYTRYGQFCGDPYRDWDAADAKSPETEEQIVAESPETEEQIVAESPAGSEREVASDPVDRKSVV